VRVRPPDPAGRPAAIGSPGSQQATTLPPERADGPRGPLRPPSLPCLPLRSGAQTTRPTSFTLTGSDSSAPTIEDLLVSILRKVRWEADQADEILGIAEVQVTAVVAVHGSGVPLGPRGYRWRHGHPRSAGIRLAVGAAAGAWARVGGLADRPRPAALPLCLTPHTSTARACSSRRALSWTTAGARLPMVIVSDAPTTPGRRALGQSPTHTGRVPQRRRPGLSDQLKPP
jgi:hypothetical protein